MCHERWLQALQERWAGLVRWQGGAVCKEGMGLYDTCSWQWNTWEPLARREDERKQTHIVVGTMLSTIHPRLQFDAFFHKELRSLSRPPALLSMSDFRFSGINWKHHTADGNRSRKFLKHVEDNFLEQILRKRARTGLLFPYLLLANREGKA